MGMVCSGFELRGETLSVTTSLDEIICFFSTKLSLTDMLKGISLHFANRLSTLTMHRHPCARTARFIDCLKNLLVPRAELKIRKTFLVSPDSLKQVVHLEYPHVELAQSAAGEIKAKES